MTSTVPLSPLRITAVFPPEFSVHNLWKSARQSRWNEKAPFNEPDFAVVRLFQLMSAATRANVQLASDIAK